jgi:hypothetical protein
MARVWLTGAVVAMGALAIPVGSGADSASRIIDRTLVCRMTGVGYPDPARFLDLQASPRLGDSSPDAGVYGLPDVSASFKTGPDFGHGTGSAAFRGCTSSPVRLRPSSRDLSGGPTSLGARYTCEVPARVLIRLRAVFRRPVILRRREETLFATGRIATAYLAVATLPGRKPLAFVSVNDATGKARIFVARSTCVPKS